MAKEQEIGGPKSEAYGEPAFATAFVNYGAAVFAGANEKPGDRYLSYKKTERSDFLPKIYNIQYTIYNYNWARLRNRLRELRRGSLR